MKETITSVTEKMNVPIEPLFSFLAAESVKQGLSVLLTINILG